ncbi:MAG: 2OG-Fe(II) oxygenase [Cyanobacteria bacterium J06621_8]
MQEQGYQKALEDHSPFLPQLNHRDSEIVDTLHQEGVCVLPIESLDLPSTDSMMERAYLLADNLRNIPDDDNKIESCEVAPEKEDLREFPEVLRWALEPRLLDIVENYIGLPIIYQGFGVRRSVADGKYSGVRRWHIDWEDRRTIKVIIYLNDVTSGGGPYEYIPRPLTEEAIEKLNYYNLGFISDEDMSQAIAQENWSTCFANKGTVVITDSSNVFHRAQPPTDTERFSITFCYTSYTPQVIWRSRKISRQEWELFDSSISQRQRDCLTKRRFG